MKAGELTLQTLLEGKKQYVVPLFQRPYSWTRKNWQVLWEDVLETYDHEDASRHFLGSIVTKAVTGGPGDVARHILIDGQQRLTTLTILLAALRDVTAESNPELSAEISSLYTTNQFTKDNDRFKVLPTQVDRATYARIILHSEGIGEPSRIDDAYKFFHDLLLQNHEGKSLNFGRLKGVILNRLEMVSVWLESPDNEYRIFESLNGKGMSLSQADLIRNYFFMRIPVELHDEVYPKLWLPMQQSLRTARGHDGDLELFFRYQLMSEGHFVRETDIYEEWRERIGGTDEAELPALLQGLAKRAQSFRLLIAPQYEPATSIQSGLRRLNRWGGQTMYPFLLFLYERYSDNRIDKDEFASSLNLIESFLVRRAFCRVPTNQLNRLFATLSKEIPDDVELGTSLRTALSSPGKRWPSDAEFVDGIASYPLYTDSRPEQRKLILERLDQWQNKEAPSDYEAFSIEHVMPQGLSEQWKVRLGSDWKAVHESLLHTLGNLTLTGYNAEMSNLPFSLAGEPATAAAGTKPKTKRQWLNTSGTRMSHDIAKYEEWNGNTISHRAEHLATVALKIWPGPEK